MDHDPPDQPVSAAPVAPAPRPAATPGGPRADWPVRAADAIDGVVAGVHDRFIRPVIVGARAVVFGLLILAASIVLAVLVSVALVRLLTVYVFDGRVWASYLLLGSLFTLGGLFLWSQRNASLDAVDETAS